MRRAIATATLLGVAAVACTGGTGPSGDAATESSVAITTCRHLRMWSDEVVASLNATSRAISSTDDRVVRGQHLRNGFDELEALTDDLLSRTDELDLGEAVDADRLRSDLGEGARLAADVVREQRDRFNSVEEISDEDRGGLILAFFDVGEEIFFYTEPPIVGYDPALAEAILAESSCDNLLDVT